MCSRAHSTRYADAVNRDSMCETASISIQGAKPTSFDSPAKLSQLYFKCWEEGCPIPTDRAATTAYTACLPTAGQPQGTYAISPVPVLSFFTTFSIYSNSPSMFMSSTPTSTNTDGSGQASTTTTPTEGTGKGPTATTTSPSPTTTQTTRTSTTCTMSHTNAAGEVVHDCP